MNILAIIQARTGSTRLPDKIMLKLEGKTVLEHVVNRVRQSKMITEVLVATTNKREDLAIVDLCKKLKVKFFQGSKNDVLDRYYQAVRKNNPDHIVRITADCPVIDPKIIDQVISKHLQTKADFTNNQSPPTYPDGLDVSIFTFKALQEAWQKAKLPSEREHVTPYMRRNKHKFKFVKVTNKINLSAKRWTLDEKEDYIFLKKIYSYLYPKNNYFGMKEMLEFLENNPMIEKINSHINRNEGYLISLKEDRRRNETE